MDTPAKPLPENPPPAKAAWVAPRLEDLGSLRHLVRGASGLISDGGSPTSKKPV